MKKIYSALNSWLSCLVFSVLACDETITTTITTNNEITTSGNRLFSDYSYFDADLTIS